VVICLKLGADLHMAQLMPLPLKKFMLVLSFWYQLTRVVPDKGPLNGCVCVRVGRSMAVDDQSEIFRPSRDVAVATSFCWLYPQNWFPVTSGVSAW